jgi:hypothetical protein
MGQREDRVKKQVQLVFDDKDKFDKLTSVQRNDKYIAEEERPGRICKGLGVLQISA